MPAASGCSSASVRDEHEQVTYLRELTEIFEAEEVDLAAVTWTWPVTAW